MSDGPAQLVAVAVVLVLAATLAGYNPFGVIATAATDFFTWLADLFASAMAGAIPV